LVGNIAYDQREQSFDNYISRLIRHTIEYIKTKQSGKLILARAKEEINRIVEATPRYKLQDRQKVLNENKKHTVRHAYFREYRALQRLCVLILQHQKQELSSGITQVYGVLFDGAWLWEEYVNCLVSDMFHHPMNKAGKDVQWLFTGEKRVTGKIYPDFIGKDNYKNLIADAKYKPLTNIQGRDYLQVLAYMFRFDATKGIYFYPEAQKEEDLLLKLNRGSSFTQVIPREDIYVIKHGLKIPQAAENYQDFRTQMNRAEEDFKSGLLALV
jgi:5-methylcytosine-specific restriction endonuclease McrBC regulatory subunit McrC